MRPRPRRLLPGLAFASAVCSRRLRGGALVATARGAPERCRGARPPRAARPGRERPSRRAAGAGRIRRAAQPDASRERDLQVLLASQFPLYIGVGALVPILPLYGEQFGLTQSSVGLLVSSASVAKLAANLPVGRLVDSAGRKALMVGGMLVVAVGDLGTGLAMALPALVLARLVTGAGLSMTDIGTAAWIGDATNERPGERASFLGVQAAMISMAFVLGPAVGGLAVERYGMRSIFFALTAGAILCAGGYSTLPELQTGADPDKEGPSFQELIKSWDQQALAGVSAAFYCGGACKLTILPSIASQEFGASPSEIGQVFSFLAAAAIVGTLIGGRFADWVGARAVLITCGVACSLAYLGAALAVEVHAKEAFLLCLAAWAFAAAVKSPALQAFAIGMAPEDSRGAALSVPKTVGDLTFLVAPLLLGVADDVLGPKVGLLGCGAIFALGTAVFVERTAE